MTNEKTTYNLFNPSGCLTSETMLSFLRSELSVSDQEKVNSHLKECDMCKDAIEGYALIEDKEKLSGIISEINENLNRNIQSIGSGKHPKTLHLQNRLLYLGAAASVIILIGLLYFLTDLINLGDKNSIAQQVDTETIHVPPMPKAKDQSGQLINQESGNQGLIAPEPEEELTIDDKKIQEAKPQKSPQKEDVSKAAPAVSSSAENKITPLKIQKYDDSVTESLLVEETVDNEMDEIPTENTSDLDLASNQPVEYYLGGVVVYDNAVEGITLDEISPQTLDFANNRSEKSMKSSGKKMTKGKSAEVAKEKQPVQSTKASVTESERSNNEHFFTLVDMMPQFPGGEEALLKYISEHIQYPADAVRLNIQGTVIVSFIVEKDGSITSARIVRGIGGGCDEEALRVISSMPDWQPAKKDNHPMQVLFNIPITFRMN